MRIHRFAAAAILAWLTFAGDSNAAEVIADFQSSAADPFRWEVVNDGVMGGLSRGYVQRSDRGKMIFRGVLSLENDGGFSSVRSQDVPMDLSNADGIALRVRGDGRTYQLRLTTDARVRNRTVAFMAPFETRSGQWIEVRIPFRALKGTWRGESVDADFDPAKVASFGIQLSDKIAGPFSLEVDWMKSYSP